MFCPKCGRENPGRNKFCNGCGSSLKVELVPPPFLPPSPPVSNYRNLPTERLKPIEKNEESPSVGKDSDLKEPVTLYNAETIQNLNGEFLNRYFPEAFKETESLATGSLSKGKAEPQNFTTEILKENEKKASPPQRANRKSKKIVLIAAVFVVLVACAGILLMSAWFYQKNQKTENPANGKTSIEKEIVKNQSPAGMTYVPGGEFMMGSNAGDEFSRPARTLTVKPFYMDKTEVTCEEYKSFIDATDFPAPSNWQGRNFPEGWSKKPVTGVTWDAADAFAKWKKKRLPTEEEWEFAARGTDERIYPWGNEWDSEMANAGGQKKAVQDVGTTKGQSPFGIFDLVGNAWEWTASDAAAYPLGKEFRSRNEIAKIIRGGYFGSQKEQATVFFRRAYGIRNEADYNNTGFRCVSDVPAN